MRTNLARAVPRLPLGIPAPTVTPVAGSSGASSWGAAVEVVSESAANTSPACPLGGDGTSLVLLGLCMRSGRDGLKMKENIDICLKKPTIFTKAGSWKPLRETPSCSCMGLPGMKVASGNCGGFWRMGTVS